MGLDVLLDHDVSCRREGCSHVAHVRSAYSSGGYNCTIGAFLGHGDLYDVFGYDHKLSVADPTRSVHTPLFKWCKDSGVPLWRPSDAHLREALTRAEEVLKEVRAIEDPVVVKCLRLPEERKIMPKDALDLARRHRRRTGRTSRAVQVLVRSGEMCLLDEQEIVALLAGWDEEGPLVHVFHRLTGDELKDVVEDASEVVRFIEAALLIPEEERNIYWYW